MNWKLRSKHEPPKDCEIMFADHYNIAIGWWDLDHWNDGDDRSENNCLDWDTHWDYLPECPK